MATQFDKSGIILTQNHETREKLRRKLAEYEKRYQPSRPNADPDSTYKYLLLKELLEKGYVETEAFTQALTKTLGGCHTLYLTNAFEVIRGYNKDDLSNIRHSSGF